MHLNSEHIHYHLLGTSSLIFWVIVRRPPSRSSSPSLRNKDATGQAWIPPGSLLLSTMRLAPFRISSRSSICGAKTSSAPYVMKKPLAGLARFHQDSSLQQPGETSGSFTEI